VTVAPEREEEMNSTKEADGRSTTGTYSRLEGTRLTVVRGVIGILALAVLTLYGFLFVTYIQGMQTGHTGIYCAGARCDPGDRTVAIFPNSPADRAGMVSGDTLLAIDGEDASAIAPTTRTLGATGIYGEGETGTTIRVRVRHANGTEQTYSLIREKGWGLDAWVLVFRWLGLSGGASEAVVILLNVIIGLAFVAPALLMAWRRADDWLAMYAGLFTIVVGVYMSPCCLENALVWSSIPMLQYINLMMILALIFLFVFPDGRLVPRWAMVPIILIVPWRLFHTLYLAPAIGIVNAGYLVDLPVWAVALGAQAHRYRKLSTPTQRQQTKWVIAGISIGAAARFAAIIIHVGAQSLLHLPGIPDIFLVRGITFMLSSLVAMAFPITLTFAMLRYRLWNIDFVISRAMIYGGLTVLLGAVFAGGFFALRALLAAALGSTQTGVAIGVSAALVVGLFAPARRRLRRFVDRRVYGIELDYQEALRAYAVHEKAIRKEAKTKSHFGQYTGLELLGRGGMGEVYRGYDPSLDRAVAIKILPTERAASEEVRKRFIREAQATARLKHPNIVQMFEIGEMGITPYMVMEYIEGRNLSEVLAERVRLPLDEALPVLQDVASALDYAHAQGIVHRDIKPSNIMLEPVTPTATGQTLRPVLMDFGLAKILGAMTQLTGTGMLGTVDYISPEQIQGSADVDGRADIYSLGIVTYQMLTGRLPFRQNNPAAILMAHLMQPAPDPRDVAPELPEAVSYAVMRAMAKKPNDRFMTAGEFVGTMVSLAA
jgi:predicted Ser/Thr protein kinase